MGGIAFLHFGQNPIGIDRGVIVKLFIGFHLLAADQHGVFLPHIFLELFHGLIEASVQLFGRVEHGRVRKFKVCHRSTSGCDLIVK